MLVHPYDRQQHKRRKSNMPSLVWAYLIVHGCDWIADYKLCVSCTVYTLHAVVLHCTCMVLHAMNMAHFLLYIQALELAYIQCTGACKSITLSTRFTEYSLGLQAIPRLSFATIKRTHVVNSS